MEQEGEHRTEVPSYTPELGTRISKAIDLVGGLRIAAKYTGGSEDSLAQWRDGKARPNFFGLQGLAKAAGVSLDWLATGIESGEALSQAETIDLKLMGRCSEAFGKLYKEMGITLSMADLGSLAGEAYNDVIAATSDPDEQYVVIKALIARRRREILNETNANNQGKLSAS